MTHHDDPQATTDQNPVADDPYAHLDSRARSVMTQPPANRIRHALGGAVVMHSVLANVLNDAEWLLREPIPSRAQGRIIVASPGHGKTIISEILGRKFPAQNQVSGTKDSAPVCAVVISLAGARTTKAVLVRILEALRCPVGRGSIAEQELRVHEILRRCNCRLLILDEAQDLRKGNTAEQFRVIEVIKHLMNRLRLNVLALGTSDAADAFQVDGHMQARFERHELPLWQPGDELAAFLRAYEQTLPLKHRSGLDSPVVMKFLVGLGGGVLDPMLRRIKNAAVHAIANGSERITLDLLRSAQSRPDVSVLNNATDAAQKVGP